MTKVLVLNHHGVSLSSLVKVVRDLGATVDLVEPEAASFPSVVGACDGVIASGGYLKSATHRETLRKYRAFFEDHERPFLGVCLGMKILGHCYDARIGKTEPVVGEHEVSLRAFPLCPELSEFRVYQNHRYGLLPPLPRVLENFTADCDPIQAVKVNGKEQYAVQFHPEVGESPGRVIFANFLSRCTGKR